MFSKHRLIPEGAYAAGSAITSCTFNYLTAYCTSKAESQTQTVVNTQHSHKKGKPSHVTISLLHFRSCGSLPPHPESKARAVLRCHRAAIQQEVLAVISKATGK